MASPQPLTWDDAVPRVSTLESTVTTYPHKYNYESFPTNNTLQAMGTVSQDCELLPVPRVFRQYHSVLDAAVWHDINPISLNNC